jgi:hypothetical protein
MPKINLATIFRIAKALAPVAIAVAFAVKQAIKEAKEACSHFDPAYALAVAPGAL